MRNPPSYLRLYLLVLSPVWVSSLCGRHFPVCHTELLQETEWWTFPPAVLLTLVWVSSLRKWLYQCVLCRMCRVTVRESTQNTQEHGKPCVSGQYWPLMLQGLDKMPTVVSFSMGKSFLNSFNNMARDWWELQIRWIGVVMVNGSWKTCSTGTVLIIILSALCLSLSPVSQVAIHLGTMTDCYSYRHRLLATEGTQSVFAALLILRWK